MNPRLSEAHASNPVRVLTQQQVDGERGSFYVHVESTSARHQGRPVYKDGFGQRFVIR